MWQRLFAGLLVLGLAGCGGSGSESFGGPNGSEEFAVRNRLRVLTEAEFAGDPSLQLHQRQTAVILLEAEDAPGVLTDDTGDLGIDVIPFKLETDQIVTLALDPEEGLFDSITLRKVGGEDELVLDATTPTASAPVAAGNYELVLDSAVSFSRSGALIPVFLKPFLERPESVLDAAFLIATGDCEECNFNDQDLRFLSDVNKVVAPLPNVTLNLKNAQLLRCTTESDYNLQRINFYGANMTDADLTGVDLRFSDLTFVTALRTKFAGAQLKGATFTDADLREADFRGASDVDISGAFVTSGVKR